MTLRAWIATWAEVGSLIAEHIGEGMTMLARAIDPPAVVDEGTARAWIVLAHEWCETHQCTEIVRRLYTQAGDEEPRYRGQASDHQEGE